MSQALSSTLNLAPCSFPGSFSSSNSSRNLLKANGGVDLRRLRYKQSINVKANADDDQTTRDNLDHLQRQTITTSTTAKPNKRVAAVAPIALWDRFPTARTVQQMMDTMERMMDDPLAYSARILSSPTDTISNTSSYSRGRAPWDIKQGESEYKLRFDMPGMTKDDVKVWVQDKMLFIKAEKTVEEENEQGEQKEEEEEEEEEEVWSAKSYGKYSSRIGLPENIEFEKIEAEVKDGVLYVSIPKADNTSAKILDINVA